MLQKMGNIWRISLNNPPNPAQFKFTRGSWATVEGNASGGFLPNRTHNWQAGDTLKLSILSWEDIGGTNSTAATNVEILSTQFSMPPLNRTRRIWLYLPPHYHQTLDSFPVLYMHDGQNLFDNATAFSGEWQVDETLNLLHAQGQPVPIVVGIDNGGAERINEYSPWVNNQYGGGQGHLYMDFIVDYLKPYIDSAYRTLPSAQNTGIMGSSLGGLISFYGGLRHQNVFSKLGIFSPSYWFSSLSYSYPKSIGLQNPEIKVYQLAGGLEGNGSVAVAIQNMRDTLFSIGIPASQVLNKVVPTGNHNELFWRQEFGEAYLWLFGNQVSVKETDGAEVKVFPNPSSDSLRIVGLDTGAHYRIYNSLGQQVAEAYISEGFIDISNLKAGNYYLHFITQEGIPVHKSFIKK